MKKWQDLGIISRILLGILFLAAAMIMPELMLIIDVGGLEMVFGFFVLYIKAIVTWFNYKLDQIKSVLNVVTDIVMNSSVANPKTLSVHAVYCVLVFLGSGSLLFSMSFFFQGILINTA